MKHVILLIIVEKISLLYTHMHTYTHSHKIFMKKFCEQEFNHKIHEIIIPRNLELCGRSIVLVLPQYE